MKTLDYVIIGALAFLYWRGHNGATVGGITRTAEAIPDQGTNPLQTMWGLLNGVGMASPNFPNIIPGSPTADPGGNAAANLGLMPTWDGSLT